MCHSDNTMFVGLEQGNSDRELTRMSDSIVLSNDVVIHTSKINSDIDCATNNCNGSSNIQNTFSDSAKKIGEGGNQQLLKGSKSESSILKEKLTEHVETVKDTEVNNCDIELVSCDRMESNYSVHEEELDTFDVYNIETALPDIDWMMLEEKLKAASEEAKQIQEARKNDREEIRKKLAMGGDDCCDDDDDEEDEDISYKKPTLQSRLHSGLQICFMNESPGDTDNESLSPKQHYLHDNLKFMSKGSSLVDSHIAFSSKNNYSTVRDLNATASAVTHIESTASAPRLQAHLQDTSTSEDDFQSKRDQLQNEAKMALAQAGTMAHMQLEVERQVKMKSPMAEIFGIPSCLGERRRKKVNLCQLQQMNLSQIQVLYNDLQTQVESLNEELVHLLMDRDEKHMEQDSMLVDIEDLTRRAEELAAKTNREDFSKARVEGKLPAR